MVALICFAVISDSVDSRKDNHTGSDENSMPCVNDDCGKSCVIFLSYKKAYIKETKIVLVKEDCSWVDLYMMIFVNHFWYC